jgi:hypothetical protein
MGNKIRWVKPNQVYEVSLRTVDRQFLFVPNHHPENPLLASTCHLNALDLNNDLIPEPSIINIIGAALGRALEANPVRLHCFEVNVNHMHEELSADEEQVDNVAEFMRCAHSLIARGVNKTWDREGHVFGGKARIHPCIDDKAAEQKLLYAVTNPIKDNLLESPSKSPLFSTYDHQAKGKPLRFWYIDWDAYWTAGGNRKKSHRVKDYLKWVTWSCAPLPSQLNMSESQRQTWMRKQVKDIVNECRQTRKQEGKSVLGKRALFELDPRDRPKNPKRSGSAPLCHASDKELAKEYRKQWREFVHQFIQASADYRRGHYFREFPEGSYRPPLVKIYKAEGT